MAGYGVMYGGSWTPEERGCCRQRLLQRHRFDNGELERMYRWWVFPVRRSALRAMLVLLIITTVTMTVLHFVFGSQITVESLGHIALSVLLVLILIFIHTRYLRPAQVPLLTGIILLLVVGLVTVSLPVNYVPVPPVVYTPADGLWQTLYVIVLVYVFLPLPLFITILTGILLPASQVVTSIFFAKSSSALLWRQITANIIIYTAGNIVGGYLHDRREHAQRKAFLEARDCFAARLQAETENEKLDRLLHSVFPAHVVTEIADDVRRPHNDSLFHKLHVQTYDSVSILFADMVGFPALASQCTAQELVKILNELYGRFDQLSTENHCLRLRLLGDCYFCVSGLPEARPDHATCCVQLALDLLDTTSVIAKETDVELSMRVGIHTGRVMCGILGLKKWQYDVWSHDVLLTSYIETAGIPGRVHISQRTLDHLHGEYDVEAAEGWERHPALKQAGLPTYFIVANHPRKPHPTAAPTPPTNKAQSRMSFRHVGSVVMRLLANMKSTASMPFSQVIEPGHEDKSNKVGMVSDKMTQPINFKRQASYQRGCSDPVNRSLEHAILTKAIHKQKTMYVNYFSLKFKNDGKERRYGREDDPTFPTAMLCCLVLLVMIAAVQALILPRTLLLLLLFLVSFCWIAIILIIFMGARMQCINCDLQESVVVRNILMVVTVLLIYTVAQVNVLCCRGGLFFTHLSMAGAGPVIAFNSHIHLGCDMPQYIWVSALLSFLVLLLFLRLAAIIKLLLAVMVTAGFLLVVEYTHIGLFTHLDKETNPHLPSHVVGVVALGLFLLAVLVYSRQQEWIYRLRFIWGDQAREERDNTIDVQATVQRLLHNLLPTHVATNVMDSLNRGHLELYSQGYPAVGVMFVSIPNFTDAFSQLDANCQDMECMRQLNEAIVAFDELLAQDRFRGVLKIKTVGATYMCAIGLTADTQILETEECFAHHLRILVEFAFAMREKVKIINASSYTNFQLRAGLNIGQVVGGVVGAKKPQYDLWGSTVNIARRLDRTCHPEYIQVPEHVYHVLHHDFEFACQGKLAVSGGKSELLTYVLLSRKGSDNLPMAQHKLNNLSASTTSQQQFNRQNSKDSATGGRSHQGAVVMSGHVPTAVRLSKENVQQGSSSPSNSAKFLRMNSRSSAEESPKLNNKSSMTPPNSLGRKRRISGGGNSSKENVRKPSNTSMTAYLSPPIDPMQGRIASPDLPAVHFCNTAMQGSANVVNGDSTTAASSGFGTNTLTQSQILHPGLRGMEPGYRGSMDSPRQPSMDSPCRSSRTASCASNDSVSSVVRNPLLCESPRAKQFVAHSEPNINIATSGVTRPTPTHSHGNINMCVGQGPSRQIPALPEIQESLTEGKTSSSAASDCERRSDAGSDAGPRNNSPTNSDISAINQVMFEIGCPEHRMKKKNQALLNRHRGTPPRLEKPIVANQWMPQMMALPKQDKLPDDWMHPPVSANQVAVKSAPKVSLLPKQNSLPDARFYMIGASETPESPVERKAKSRTLPTSNRANPAVHVVTGSGDVYQNVYHGGARPKDRIQEFSENGELSSSSETESSSPPPLPPPPPDDLLEASDDDSDAPPARLTDFLQKYIPPNHTTNNTSSAVSALFQQLNMPVAKKSAFSPVKNGLSSTPEDRSRESSTDSSSVLVPVMADVTTNGEMEHHNGLVHRPVPTAGTRYAGPPRSAFEARMRGLYSQPPPPPPPPPAPRAPGHGSRTRWQTPLYQVKRRQPHKVPARLTRSLDHIPSDLEDCTSVSSRGGSPSPPAQINGTRYHDGTRYADDAAHEAFIPINALIKSHLLPDNISLSSVGSSEMSRSDPALNYDSGSAAYESEYDNYRPGMASDEDYFVPEPISDVDLDMFDEINIDNVTVSDAYSLDMPKVKKQITEV